MNTQIFEAAGSLGGLPKHWIKYLAERWGKGYNDNMAGEKSIITPLKKFDGGNINKALKDKNNIGVIGRIDGKPLFLIVKHDEYQTKYRVFEVSKGEGRHDAHGQRYYRGGRRGRSVTSDAYTMGEVIDIVDMMYSKYPEADLTAESISVDPERGEKSKGRRERKSVTDPLYRANRNKWEDPYPNIAQTQRAKNWAEKKRPILDAKMEEEAKKMKDKINAVIDDALDKALANVKRGYSYDLNKDTLGKAILAQVDMNPLVKLADGYYKLSDNGSNMPVWKKAKSLKQSGLIP